jgi:integrase
VRKLTLPKNGLKRVIYLTPQAADALRRTPHQTDDYVFCTPQGKRYTGVVNWYYWTPVRNSVGRPDWDFYALRHFFGTYLANHGVSAPDIAQALGHTDGGKLALSRYIHVAGKDSRARIAAMTGSNVRPILEVSVATGERHAEPA